MANVANVSVIVPVYNEEKTVEECIRSLLAIKYPKEHRELIFVNNASTDRTLEMLSRYKGEIRILYEGKRGPAAARNKGLLNARGDVVAFTDADCFVAKEWLQEIVTPLQDPLVGIVGGRNLSKQPANRIEKLGEEIHDHHKAINVFQPPYVITMNWSSRLSVLKEVHMFDENFIRCEDVDLSHRISQAGYRLVYKPEAIIYHQNKSTYISLFREGFAHGFYSVQALKKHRAYVQDFGHQRFDRSTYVAILASLRDYLKGNNPERSICYADFNLGKKIGKMFGSIRFLSLDL